MKCYLLKAEILFEAEDLNDALVRLGEHFSNVAVLGDDAPSFIVAGKIEIDPVEMTCPKTSE